MKFSRKMILIPVSGREEPETEKMSELDQEMSAIIKNPRLSSKEKVEMYNEVLRRNLIFESRLFHKPQGIDNKIDTSAFDVSSTSNSLLSSSQTPNTSAEIKDEDISPKLPKKELKFQNKRLLDQIKFEEIKNNKSAAAAAAFVDEDNDDDDIEDGFDETDEKKPIWESTPTNIGRLLRGGIPKVDYYESASSLKGSLEKKKKNLKKNKYT